MFLSKSKDNTLNVNRETGVDNWNTITPIEPALTSENVTLKEGQSQSQWYELSHAVANTKEIRQFPQCQTDYHSHSLLGITEHQT